MTMLKVIGDWLDSTENIKYKHQAKTQDPPLKYNEFTKTEDKDLKLSANILVLTLRTYKNRKRNHCFTTKTEQIKQFGRND